MPDAKPSPAPAPTGQTDDRWFFYQSKVGSTHADFDYHVDGNDFVRITEMLAALVSTELNNGCTCDNCVKARRIVQAVTLPTSQSETVQ